MPRDSEPKVPEPEPDEPTPDPLKEGVVTKDNVELRVQPVASPEAAQVIALHRSSDAACHDSELVKRMLEGDIRAKALFFDRYGSNVRGIIVRLLGPRVELADLTHDVFATAFKNLHKLKKPEALKAWLTSVAVFRAREYIRRRRRHRWLEFFSPDEVPEQTAVHADAATREAVAAVYSILERLPTEQRLAFSLKFLAGMKIDEGADATGVSPSTFKRRLRQARELFEREAGAFPELESWVEGEA